MISLQIPPRNSIELRSSRNDMLNFDVCSRVTDARDARFDGLFFVGITTTRIYCRPVCPARVSYPERRRFFDTAAAAERAGFRPCLRCRPELAPGRALIDAVPRLATVAAHRISAGALNGQGVAVLATELGVSERHLRRALEREIGVSPVELAQTYRLLLAKRLLADTSLSVTRIAFASGFQSLRRFNTVFRERYRMSPSALRRSPGASSPATPGQAASLQGSERDDLVKLTLTYRPPLAWHPLLNVFRREAIPGVETFANGCYGRTVSVEGVQGVVFVRTQGPMDKPGRENKTSLYVELSPALLPVLMPLLARLRQVFDLDAEPAIVDEYLERGGLGHLVRRRPGIRIPGAMNGFEAALRVLLGESGTMRQRGNGIAQRVISRLGERFDSGFDGLNRLMPSADRVADAGSTKLTALGVQPDRAKTIAALSRAVARGSLRLEPGTDVSVAQRNLTEIEGMDEGSVEAIVMRSMSWPDAFPASDPALLSSAGESCPTALLRRAERWRPWRTYAALHLWLGEQQV
jgi:AraC family transcriptional regulator of adaptative response / DNA-3-methyladenine glycosylase II